jgi:hypothetical protein
MAVDFSLRPACDVRKAIPEPKLASLVRHRSLAEFAQVQFRRAHPELDDQAIRERLTVNIAVNGPDGMAREMPVTLSKLFAMTKELDPWRATCAPCRANVADRPFGCIGKINYPIAPESEAWLLTRLPQDAGHPGLALLFRFLADLGFDGATVDKARGNTKLFSQPRAAVRHWGEGAARQTITSSQLLQFLVFAGEISPKHAALYTRVLNLETVLKDPHPPSPNIEQFKTFFCAVVMAGRLECALGVEG